MDYTTAKALADVLVGNMRPYCERIEITGSIRREKPEVKDIEIVCIPRIDTEIVKSGLFGDELPVETNRLWEWATGGSHNVQWIKPGTSEIVDWIPKADGKYWRGYLPEHDCKLDLFLAKPDNFGTIFLIRTGSAEFSQAVVTKAKHQGTPCEGGYFTQNGKRVYTPEEIDVFKLLDLDYVEPVERHDGWCLKRKFWKTEARKS